MKFKLLFFSLIFLFSLSTKAADPEFYRLTVTTKRWEVAERSSFLNGRVSKEILNQLDSIYQNLPTGYDLNYDPSSQTLKIFIHCSFDFYSIQDGQLVKEYQFANRGYTCGSYFFEKNNAYYILGGRGLWNSHADLMEFDTLNGSWEFKQASYQPLDYYPLGAYQTSKGMMTWLGEYTNPRIPRLEKEANGFFLDMEKKSWQPFKINIEEFDFAEIAHADESQLYETEDYALSVTRSQLPNLGWYIWIIIEKETGKLFFYEGNKHTEMYDSPFLEVIGNKFRYFEYTLNSTSEGKEKMIDLDLIRSQSREIGQLVLLDPKENKETASLFPLAVWIGFPLVLLLGFWMGRQLQNKKKEEDLTPLDPEKEGEDLEEESGEILQRLLAHDGEKLSTEEFDTALGIHQITNFDSKRIKRSRLIKALNKQYEEKKGFPLITRIKNPEDKRFVFYKITFGNGS
ncbi:MAG: hypothetical protein LW824_10830 [Algoriphagus sp.]|nr:hypothetical protein [Algoriphagus sp.]MCE2778084.1 hypothetical protein [Algoriphagus sp.]